ncbi:MAG: LuxR family transcriptional regulator [Frankiales bacterium]|nr:LuxR family transcriptional regulator [Frankiales bacterium]
MHQLVVVCDEQLLAAEALALALASLTCQVHAVEGHLDALSVVSDDPTSVLVLSLRGRTPFDDERIVTACRRAAPTTRIVCLTGLERHSLHRALLRAGAQVVLHRGHALKDVLLAVSGCVSGALPSPREQADPTRLRFLTRQEQRTLDLMRDVRTTREIATGLGISHSTARCYVQTVIEKLGAHSRLEAVAHSHRHWWPDLEGERCG